MDRDRFVTNGGPVLHRREQIDGGDERFAVRAHEDGDPPERLRGRRPRSIR